MMGDFLKDDDGHQSSLRIVWSICTLMIFFVWGFISIKNNQLVNFEVGEISLITLLFSGKIIQKKVEKGGKVV